MGDFLIMPPLNVNTWHYRGGLSDNARVVYAPDEYGNINPIVIGQDAYGNDVVITEDSPWYANLLQQGIQVTGNIFGSGRGYGRGNDQAAVAVTAQPQGITAGISTNMLLIGGAILAFFLLGKRGR